MRSNDIKLAPRVLQSSFSSSLHLDIRYMLVIYSDLPTYALSCTAGPLCNPADAFFKEVRQVGIYFQGQKQASDYSVLILHGH